MSKPVRRVVVLFGQIDMAQQQIPMDPHTLVNGRMVNRMDKVLALVQMEPNISVNLRVVKGTGRVLRPILMRTNTLVTSGMTREMDTVL